MGTDMARMTIRYCIGLTVLILAACATLNVHAAGVKEEAQITWSIDNVTIKGAPGETIKLKLKADFPKGWHTYTTRTYQEVAAPYTTRITVAPDTLLKLGGEITATNVKTEKNEAFDMPIDVIEESCTFTVPVTISADAKAGDQVAKLNAKAQLCNDAKCLLPKGKELTFTITVTEKGAAAPAPDKPKEKSEAEKPTKPIKLGGDYFDLRGGAKKEAEVAWSIDTSALAVKGAPGETIEVKLKAEIPKGWHSYSAKAYEGGPSSTVINIGPDQFLKIAGEISATSIKTIPKNSAENPWDFPIEEIEESSTFTIPVAISEHAEPGELQVGLTVRSQLCSAPKDGSGGKCLPPETSTLLFPLTVTEKGAAKPKSAASVPLLAAQSDPPKPPAGTSLDKARQSGLLAYFFLAMASGFVALFTPCVFPMVPITVNFFTKRMHATRLRAILDAAVFAVGIVGTFTGLGFMFALLFGASSINKLVANGYFNLAFTGVMLVFALNLFGVFEIQVPSFILNRLNKSSSKSDGFASVLLMGLLFSLTSFTCTGPFVGQTLVSAAKGDWLWPLFGMFGFAIAFAAPFIALALFPSAIKTLPKAGGWLNSVKVVGGFMEVALAMKYLSGADLAFRWGFLTREVNLSIWIAVAALTTAYLLGWFQMTHDTPLEKVGGVRVIFASCFLAAGVWMATGLQGRELGYLDSLLPPVVYPGQQDTKLAETPGGKHTELTWMSDFDAARAEAARTRIPIFVDFTGYTCTNCNLMERKIFPDPDVSGLLSKFIRVRLYTDGQKDAAEAAQSDRNQKLEEERYQTTALPFYAILSPDDKRIAEFADGMTYDPKKFADFLSNGFNAASTPDLHPPVASASK